MVSDLRRWHRTFESCGLVPPRIRFVRVLDGIGIKGNSGQADMMRSWVGDTCEGASKRMPGPKVSQKNMGFNEMMNVFHFNS